MVPDMISLRKLRQRKCLQKFIPPDEGKQGHVSGTVNFPRADDKLLLISF